MDFYRVGDKLVSRDKVMGALEKILELRTKGLSQHETAQRVGVDRSFISRLEALGEVRKGGSLAILGFPLENKDELLALSHQLGADYVFLMTDAERHAYIQGFNGVDLLNELMGLMTRLKEYDIVVMIGSDMRIRLAEAILGEKVMGIPLGESPITDDVYLDPEELRRLISTVKGGPE